MKSLTETFVRKYEMQPHLEGGWYKENYKSIELIPAEALPGRFAGSRSFSTAIYFLLERNNFSAFHRIKSDECWHFYSGDPLQVFVIYPNGKLTVTELGNDLMKDLQFQYVVPANCWFASRPSPGSECCFVGCTVAPGFDFADFELASASDLTRQYPQHGELIQSLCRL